MHFAKDSRILMADGQYKNIQDIDCGEETTSGKVLQVQVENVKMVKLFYQNWYTNLSCSTDCKIKVGNDYIPVSDLNQNPENYKQIAKGSKLPGVVLPSGANIIDYPYEIGYFIGLYAGYGTCNDKVTFKFGPNHELITQVEEVLTKLFLAPVNTHFTNDIYHIDTDSEFVKNFFTAFGDKLHRTIPKKYWVGNNDFLTGIFDGLIDQDPETNELRFIPVSKEMAEFFVWQCSQLDLTFTCESATTFVYPLVIINNDDNVIEKSDLGVTKGWSLVLDSDTDLIVNNLQINI